MKYVGLIFPSVLLLHITSNNHSVKDKIAC